MKPALLNIVLTATLLQGGLCLSAEPSATLKVGDLFVTPDAEPLVGTPLVTFEQLNNDVVPTLWPRLDAEHAAGHHDVVLATTEVLLAWIPPTAPEYGEALWYRARAYAEVGDLDRVDRVATTYLKSFPKGPRLGWFLVRVARGWMREQKPVEAAAVWAVLLDEKIALSPEEAMEAAIVFDLAFRPVDVRRALDAAPGLAGGAKGSALVVRSLLMADDPSRELPKGELLTEPEDLLVFGFLLEARGRREEAVPAYRAVLADKRASQALHDAASRRLDDRWKLWPPPTTITSP
ncbi:hypothetical protein GC173_10875 [bacterium]|nr:hypothetical protein [bacterium]